MACKLLTLNFGTISDTVVSSANFRMTDKELSVVVSSFIVTKKSHEPIWVSRGIPVGTGVNSEKHDTLGSLR